MEKKRDRLKIPENILIVILIIVLSGMFFYYFQQQKTSESTTLRVGRVEVDVEIANTPVLRSKGLSGRESLDSDKGMLFVFDNPELQQFWMKDMQFPLDVIWITNNRVAGLTENVPVPYGLTIPQMRSEVPVERVLEVNAGFVAENGIKIGDSVDFVK